MRSRDTMLRLHRFRTEEKRRQVADIEGMINDFMRKYDDLERSVKFEESRNGVSDPTHFNYSLPGQGGSRPARQPDEVHRRTQGSADRRQGGA